MSFTLPRFKLGKSARKKTDRDGNGSGSHDGKHHSIDVLLRHDLKQLSKLRAEQLEGYLKEDLESLPLDRRQVLPAEVLSTLNPRALNQLPGKTIAKLSTAAQITLKSLKQSLGFLNSTMSTAELHRSVASLETGKAEIQTRLVNLRSGNVKPVSKEERDAVDGKSSE